MSGKVSGKVNANLIPLDQFKQLPPKKYQCEAEARTLKKKKKKSPQGKKLFLPLNNTIAPEVPSSSAADTAPKPNNHVDFSVNTAKTNEPTRLPPPHHPTTRKLPSPIFYPPVVHPMANFRSFYSTPLFCQLNQLKVQKQPLTIIDPISLKQIEIVNTINPKEKELIGQYFPKDEEKIKQSYFFIPRRFKTQEFRKLDYVIPNMIIETNRISTSLPTTDSWFDHLNRLSGSTSKSSRAHKNNHCIAIDCEMVGIGKKGKYSLLARVSIVNYYGEVILDKYVKPTREITDYRTQFSGITPELLANANEFKQVQKEVESIMKDHIVVGQSIHFDFRVLKTEHSEHLVRDTAFYNVIFGPETEKGSTPSLKKLAKNVLGINIQEGEHDSIEDAKAAMILYRHRQAEWEEYLKKNGYPKTRGCKICDSPSHVVRECPYKRMEFINDKLGRDDSNRYMKYDDNIGHDEYNRDPNTSKYCLYNYTDTNNYNSYFTSPYTPAPFYHNVNYQNVNYHNVY